MHDAVHVALACASGASLGGLYFAGLWWTVRRSLRSRQPALLLLSSALIRTILVIAGFHAVSGGRWQALLGCLAGFIGAKMIAVRIASTPQESPDGD